MNETMVQHVWSDIYLQVTDWTEVSSMLRVCVDMKTIHNNRRTHSNTHVSLSRLRTAVCQRSAVLLWLQLWGQTPLISENWIWVTTTCRTQQWRSCVVFYRVQPVDWRLWGQTSVHWLLWISYTQRMDLRTNLVNYPPPLLCFLHNLTIHSFNLIKLWELWFSLVDIWV